MSNAKRKELAGTGRGAVGKTAIVGAKDRATNQVSARVVESTDKPTLQGFVGEHTAPGATVYTDEAAAYEGMPFDHEAVKHSVAEYVRGMAHTNGMESFWSMLKRAHTGTFHKMSPKHLNRYVQEFAGKHNVRESDTLGPDAGGRLPAHGPHAHLRPAHRRQRTAERRAVVAAPRAGTRRGSTSQGSRPRDRGRGQAWRVAWGIPPVYHE